MSHNYQYVSRQPSSTPSLSSRNVSTLQKLLIAGATMNNNNNNNSNKNNNSFINHNATQIPNMRSYSQLTMVFDRAQAIHGDNNMYNNRDSQGGPSTHRKGTKLVYPTLDQAQLNSNLYADVNTELLKKQEQEIQAQLSPSFWARLNEATKPPSYSNIDFSNAAFNNNSSHTNKYSKHGSNNNYFNTTIASAAIAQTSALLNNTFSVDTKPVNNINDTSSHLNNLKNTLYSAYALKKTVPSSPANSKSNNALYNVDSSEQRNKHKSSTRPPSMNDIGEKYATIHTSVPVQHSRGNNYEKTYTPIDQSNHKKSNITLMEQLPLITRRIIHGNKVVVEETMPNGLKIIKSNTENNVDHRLNNFSNEISAEPRLRTSLSTLNLIQPPTHLNQSRSHFGTNNESSKSQLNQMNSTIQTNLNNSTNDIMTPVYKSNENDTKLNSNPMLVRPDTSFVRSKSMMPSDRSRLKSFVINNLQRSNNASNASSINNSIKVSKTIPKSIYIRSRIQNYYKDFIDELNAYSSIFDSQSSKNPYAQNSYKNLSESKLNISGGETVNNTGNDNNPMNSDELVKINVNNFESENNEPFDIKLVDGNDESHFQTEKENYESNLDNDDNINHNDSNSNEVDKFDQDKISQEQPKSDSNIEGISFSTGESGYFPAKNVERSVESDTWKIHKSHLFVTNLALNNLAGSSSNKQLPQKITQPQRTLSAIEKNARNNLFHPDSSKNGNGHFNTENPLMKKKFEANPHKSLQTHGLLRFFFVRHGERIDLAFGPQWIEQAFDRNGKYRRVNLNMPQDLPYRASKREFLGDSPLTEIGQFQAKLTGEALGIEGYKIHYCYVSPALRCVQTAHQILSAQGLEKIVKIRIEPSIFEFLGWYDKGLPTFLTMDALINFGYNIDVNYRQLLPVDRLQPDENYTDYYQRSFNSTKYLTNLHQGEGANILVVGHAGTLEVCTRQICGFSVRPYSEFNATIRKVPYLGLCLLEKEASSHIFEIQNSVIPPIGHTANFNFDPLSLKI